MANTPEVRVKNIIDKLLKKYEYATIVRPVLGVPNRSPLATTLDVYQVPMQHKIIWWYKPASGIYGKSGIPDYIGCICGKMFGIEAKANGGVLTSLQASTLNVMESAGAKIFIIHGITDSKLYGREQPAMSPSYAELEEWLKQQHFAFIALKILEN